jgi:predicted secreted hydrolase
MRYLLVFLIFASCSKPFITKFDIPKKAANLPYEEIKHPKNSLEWWYLTGFLEDYKGNFYGVEYVFFHFYTYDKLSRVMVNAAISLPKDSVFYYDYAINLTKDILNDTLPLNFKMGNYRLQGASGNFNLNAQMKKHPVGFNLTTKASQAPILHNDSGYVYYGNLADAGYYSYSRLQTNGDIIINGDTISVKGLLWYDRQWNCGSVSPMKISWDWLSVHFDDGSDLMLYQVNDPKKNVTVYGGTFKDSAQKLIIIKQSDIKMIPKKYWKSPKTKKVYPMIWDIQIDNLNAQIQLQTMFPNQELTMSHGFQKLSYWEGMCKVNGFIKGKTVQGNAYLEMTNKKNNKIK